MGILFSDIYKKAIALFDDPKITRAYNGRDVQFFCQKTYEFHHDHRSDGNTDIILFALVLYKVAEYIGTHTFSYVRTIVCGYVQIADS